MEDERSSTKRAAESEINSSNSKQRLEISTSSTILSPLVQAASVVPVSNIEDVVKLQGWGERLRGDIGSLSKIEVDDLASTIEAVCEIFLAPLSRTDLLRLLRQRYVEPQSTGVGLNNKSAIEFPSDVIALIIDEWRDLFNTAAMKNFRSGEHQSWIELSRLAKVNKLWDSVAGTLKKRELHLTKIDQLPIITKHLGNNSIHALALTKLHIKIIDFEHFKVDFDAGFSLPTLISLLSNLQTLSVTSSRLNRMRSSSTFRNITGGVNLVNSIMDLQHLSQLIYSPPILFEDLIDLLHKPSLTSLDILGDVESINSLRENDAIAALLGNAAPLNNNIPIPPGSPNEMATPLTTISPNLHRVWTPTTSYKSSELHELFDDSSLDELALVVDMENGVPSWLDDPLTPEEIIQREQAFVQVFETIGKQLKALSISSRRLPSVMGGTGGMGGQFQITIGVGGGPGGPPPGGPGGIPPAPHAGGGGRMRAAPPGGGNNPVAQMFFGMGGGPGGAGVPGVGGMPMGGMGMAGLAALFGGGGGGGGGVGGAPANAPPASVFFDEIISACTALEHLEIYGRRHSSALAESLSSLPLRYLSVTRPRGAAGALLHAALIELLDTPSTFKKSFKEMALCGRDGQSGYDWEVNERMEMKNAVESAGCKYSSSIWRRD